MRDAVEQPREIARQVGVPGVGVHQVGAAHGRHHRQVGREGLQRAVGCRELCPRPVGDRLAPVRPLAVHGQPHQAADLAGEVLHVHARTAVDLGRVLPRQHGHARPPARPRGRPRRSRAGLGHSSTVWPLPTTVTPPSDTTNPRARSWSLSTPTTAPSGITTFLSRIAFSTTACRPIRVLSSTTARSTRDQLSTRTPGDRTELRTRPPDTITPLLTTLLMARPIRSPASCTNLAGGCEGTWVRIGHRSL